jgi:hypothetical protein
LPELDFALIADYVSAENGVAYVMRGAIDTVFAESIPTGRLLGFLFRVGFTRNECGRPHRIEVIFQDEDGERLAQIQTVVAPEWKPDLPPGWKVNAVVSVNMPVPFPRYGLYSFEVLINDSHAKTIQLRVVQPPADEAENSENATSDD